MIQAAIFDMDGLLIDSEPFWRAAHIAALAEQGHAVTEDDVRAMAGKRTDEVVAHWHEQFTMGITPTELENRIVNEVIEQIKANGTALPGVRHVIDMFTEHDVPMAVASSSPPILIDAVLERLDLQRYMRLAHSAKYEKFGKPHPAVFLSTASKLEIEPEKCLVFEDAVSGIRAAKAAGMKCIAVPEPVNRAKPEFTEADLVLDSLEEVTWPQITSLW